MYWLRRLLMRSLGIGYSPSTLLYEAMRDAFDRVPDIMQEEKAMLKEQRERHKQEVP